MTRPTLYRTSRACTPNLYSSESVTMPPGAFSRSNRNTWVFPSNIPVNRDSTVLNFFSLSVERLN